MKSLYHFDEVGPQIEFILRKKEKKRGKWVVEIEEGGNGSLNLITYLV